MPRPLFHSRRATFAALVVLAIAALAIPGLVSETPAAARPALRGANAMAVTVDSHASRVAADILRDGGNAVDAAVAAAFTLSVTYPCAGSLGGGGFLLYRSADGEYFALDFREVAPRALRAELFLDDDGHPIPERSKTGGLAVGVPGVVAGLAEAHRRWGTRPWKELLAPAISIAEEGLTISRWNAETLARRAEDLAEGPGTAELFTLNGAPLSEGDRLVQPELAATLRRIADNGSQGFYVGPTAEAVVRTVRQAGGVMEAEDLATYAPVLREPVQGSYRGYRVTSFPPPSSGGVVLLQILGMLERFDLADSGFGSSLTVHRMAEAERRAYADRSRWLGDPDFSETPVAALLDPGYLDSRAKTIKNRKATPSRKISPGQPAVAEATETTHLSVTDPDGGAVAMTITLNQWFGAAMVADGTGVVLNNEMDDFALAPGIPNLYGLVGGEANAPAGGKRPLSSMTPTIVEAPGGGPRPFLVLGSPGGSTIISAVLQVLINVVDHDMPLQAAVNARRFHHQWLPDRIDHEPRAFPADVVKALEKRGHELHPRGPIANVSAIGLAEDGAWLGAADPRREGHAAGF
jgi:gamma-glutamyltranspeptidase/glutathione hydrolase